MRNSPSKTILIVENDKIHKANMGTYFNENTDISLIIKEDIRSAVGYVETIQRNPLSLPGLLLINYQSLVEGSQLLFSELSKRKLRAYIPIIALSDTDDKDLVDEAYHTYGVASFLGTPTSSHQWHSLFDILTRYWFNEVTLPNYSVARHG